MCDCISQTTADTLDHLRTTLEAKAEVTTGSLTQVAILFSKACGARTYTEFGYRSRDKKKDGTLANEKKKVVSMLHTFCPFCGIKYEA